MDFTRDLEDYAMENDWNNLVDSQEKNYVYYAKYEKYENITWDYQVTGIFPNVEACMDACPNKKNMEKFLLEASKWTLGCCVLNVKNHAQVSAELKKWNDAQKAI